MKKRHFTLLEVLLSSFLLTLLLSTLIYSYSTFAKDKKPISFLEERFFEKRMTAIFDKMQPPFFTTERNELVFLYDRGPQLEKDLSGKVLGNLHLDREGFLALTIWPDPERRKEDPCDTIILLDHVEKLKFSFYQPPDEPKKIVDPQMIGPIKPKKGWQESWAKKYEETPVFMKILIFRKGKIEQFVFDLPTQKVVTY